MCSNDMFEKLLGLNPDTSDHKSAFNIPPLRHTSIHYLRQFFISRLQK